MALKNILFINNNPEIYKDEILFLEREGFSVRIVRVGEEALNILSDQTEHFSLVLLDPHLNTIDEAFDTACRISSSYSIPLLFYSEYDKYEIMERMAGIRSNGFVTKSEGIANLKRAIDRIENLKPVADILARLVYRVNEAGLCAENINYTSLISQLEDAIIVNDSNGRIITANTNATNLLGISLEELKEKGNFKLDWELIHEDFTPFPIELHPALIAGETGKIQKDVIMGIRKKPDSLLWLIMTSQPVFEPDGTTLSGVVTSFRDISSEILIKNSNLKWSTIFNHADWGIVIGEAESGTLDKMNPAYAKMHGYSVRELLGKPILDVFAPEERDSVSGHIAKAHKMGTHRFESMHIRKDGTRFPALMDISTIKDSMGNPLYRIVNVVDNTKRKEQEKELKEAKEYAEKLFQNSPFAVYSVDENCRVVDFNKKAEDITGYRKEELVGKEFNMFSEKIETAEKIGREYRIITKDNKEKIIERYSTFLYDNNGRVTGNIESFIDITNWKELSEFKSDIERIIRHDLKTPLNSIIGFPKMMLTDESLSDEFKEYLMIILSSGQNMLNMINASLNMYKLEEGSFQYNLKETNVLSLIRQIALELREIIIQKKCTVEILLDAKPLNKDSVVKIKTEKSLLYMILTNLIKNALEASPKEEMVTIDISTGDTILISIHNRGVIPSEIRNTFFDKYVTSGKSYGNGLGTYSARLMADAIGAKIDFDSDEASGTTLILTF